MSVERKHCGCLIHATVNKGEILTRTDFCNYHAEKHLGEVKE